MVRITRILALALLLGALILALLPNAQAATISSLRATCTRTRVEGFTEVRSRYVRVQVTLASDLSHVLATKVERIGRNQHYNVSLNYPRQPENTRLIVSVGEWDGSQYLLPATLIGIDCNRHGGITSPTPVPTPTPFDATPLPTWTPSEPTPFPTPTLVEPPFTPTPYEPPFTPTPYEPPATPTPVLGDFYTQEWAITPTLMYDSCNIAPPNSAFNAWLVFDTTWLLVGVGYGDMHYWMSPPVTGPYIGQTTVGDALYTLDLFLNMPDSLTAFESVTQGDCIWQYRWDGVKI
jgi:hypothetical protein